MRQAPRLSEQRLKVNKLFANQVYSNLLQRKYGVVSCCPPPNIGRTEDLWDLLELMNYYFTEDPYDQLCVVDNTHCEDSLVERINTL